MKCPKCGARLVDGHLYCEVCGTEIQIVPDFEPEIENSMTEVMSVMAETLNPDKEAAEAGNELKTKPAALQKSMRLRFHMVVKRYAFLLCIAMIFLVAGVWKYQTNTSAYHAARAYEALEEGDYPAAIARLEEAVSQEPGNTEYEMKLGACYHQVGELRKSELIYRSVIQKDGDHADAYARLVKLYEEQEQYEKINDLLLSCTDSAIVNQFLTYVAREPVFSCEAGTYDEMQTLKLSSNTQGKIYYTTDGSDPSEHSQLYTAPIFLETGNYQIRAIFINNYGINSQIASGSYEINTEVPLSPEVSAYSGSYKKPTMIEVTVEENCKVYYTVDGTLPSQDSRLYQKPIPMPEGESHFQFISYSEEGVPGEVTERNYKLTLSKANVSPEQAAVLLLQKLMAYGVILDGNGSVLNMDGRKSYDYASTLTVSAVDCYVFAEMYEDAASIRSQTGILYAVSIETGNVFKINADEQGQYALQPL